MSEPSAITIVVGEASPFICAALAQFCRHELASEVVAQCCDGTSVSEAIWRHRPDFALLDLSLSGVDTLEIVRQLRAGLSPTRVIVLSMRRDRKTVLEALRCGAAAYILRSGPASQLGEAVRHVLRGAIYTAPDIELGKIFTSQQRKASGDPMDRLSTREYQVFLLLSEGVRAKEIAARLQVSPKTVDTYRAKLMRKLDIHDVAGLVRIALDRELSRNGA